MLLYGILETGRLLFLYSTIVTASRQAVRYGSATGVGPNGYPRYQECAEIKRIADTLGADGGLDVAAIYQDVLLRKPDLATIAAAISSCTRKMSSRRRS